MVNKIVFFTFFLLLFISCSHTVNEYGMRRYNSFGLREYPNKCNLIDSVFICKGYYKLIMSETEDQEILNDSLRKNFLVFYQNGKVGKFLDYEEDNFDFNPKKAEMGYFGIVNQKCFMKFKVKTLDGHKIIENEIVFIDKNSLEVYTNKSSTSSGFSSKFIKINSKSNNNGVLPDW